MVDRWQQIERIYHAALEMEGSDRAEFLGMTGAGLAFEDEAGRA